MTVPMTAAEVEEIIADRKRDFIIMDPNTLLPNDLPPNMPIFGIDANTVAWTRAAPNDADLNAFPHQYLEEIRRAHHLPLPSLVSYDELRAMKPEERDRIARLDGLVIALVDFIFYRNPRVTA